METTMTAFFPSPQRVAEARRVLATGQYSQLDSLMGTHELDAPHESDAQAMIGEFVECATELGLTERMATGFVVLVPVNYNGVSHTTPVLVDTEALELAFTSHPELGAGTILDEVLVGNPHLLTAAREELLGILATWHNSEVAEE